ncbi:hypothetical protein, partial [Ideonella sp.]|uniref:hypothetical protein n=1 Tax=Ideonella sp. TaxID=1929293 RepID=UPI003BB5A0C3
TWSVGSDIRVTLTVPKPQPGKTCYAVIEWFPSMPHRLTAAQKAEYRAGRDAAIQELAQASGLRIGLVEV